jgi:hypothetical protein
MTPEDEEDEGGVDKFQTRGRGVEVHVPERLRSMPVGAFRQIAYPELTRMFNTDALSQWSPY